MSPVLLTENFIQNCHYNIITLEAAPKMVGRQRSLTLRLYNTNGFPLVAKHGKYPNSLTRPPGGDGNMIFLLNS
jgi:hypothetical protein